MQQIKSLNQLQEELHRQQLQLAGIVLQEVLKAKKPRKDDEKQGIEVEIKKIVSDIAYLTFISEQETPDKDALQVRETWHAEELYNSNTLSLQLMNYPNGVITFSEYFEDFSKAYSAQFSTYRLRDALQGITHKAEVQKERYNGNLWKLTYHLQRDILSGKFEKQKDMIQAGFEHNYNILKGIIASQFALIDLIRCISEKLESPHLRNTAFSADFEALEELCKLIEEEQLEQYESIAKTKQLKAIKGLTAKKRREVFEGIAEGEIIYTNQEMQVYQGIGGIPAQINEIYKEIKAEIVKDF